MQNWDDRRDFREDEPNKYQSAYSAFGLHDNEMTQSIIAAINPRWNMTSYA
jgi:hypothetical protein